MAAAVVAWGPAVLWAAVLFLLSEISSVPRITVLAVHDKAVHLALYGVLGSALAWGRHRTGPRAPHWAPLLAGVLYGAVDEWHQSFVPHRFPSWADLGVDAVGVAVGYGLVFLALERLLGSRRSVNS